MPPATNSSMSLVVPEDALTEIRRQLKLKDDELHCDSSDSFLLSFLRHKKFDIDGALSCIYKYYKLRQEFPDKVWPRGKGVKWMKPYIALNNCTVLPQKNSFDNSWIFAWRKGEWKPEEEVYSLADYLTWSLYMTEYLLFMRPNGDEDEGWTYIMDLSGFGARHMRYCDMRVVQTYTSILQGALPLKVKAIHFINVPFVCHYVLKFIKYLLNNKLRKRVFVHSSVSNLSETIDTRCLPEEYGGTGPEFSSEWLFNEMLPYEEELQVRSYQGFKK